MSQSFNRRDLLMAVTCFPFLSEFIAPAFSSGIARMEPNFLNQYSQSNIEKMNRAINVSLENDLSGAVLHFGDSNQAIYQKAFGYQKQYNGIQLMQNPEPMREDTIFDLASVTKIFSTMLAYHILLDRKEINLDDKVSKYLPDFSLGDKSEISLRLLLQHNSGFPSSFHFYNPAQVGEKMYSQNHDHTITLLPYVPLESKPGTVTKYSDLNFLILGAIIEKISQKRQDQFVESEIYKPLGLKKTGYMLLTKGHRVNEFEASELVGNTREGHAFFPNIRTQTIQGQVHDETAFYAMEEISGNAGLFSTAHDLGVLCRLLLNEGTLGTFRLCAPEIVYLFRTTLNIDESYGLGWQIVGTLSEKIYGTIAPVISKNGEIVGHTGWTGKCVVIDFKHHAYFILLTNKKHSRLVPIPNYYDLFEADITPAGKYRAICDLFFRGVLDTL